MPSLTTYVIRPTAHAGTCSSRTRPRRGEDSPNPLCFAELTRWFMPPPHRHKLASSRRITALVCILETARVMWALLRLPASCVLPLSFVVCGWRDDIHGVLIKRRRAYDGC
jgi:hypothetical protein